MKQSLRSFFKNIIDPGLLIRWFSQLSQKEQDHPASQSCTPQQAQSPGSIEDPYSNLQTEIRSERKFSLAEAIGREGGSFMKGESAIPRPLQATTAINQCITANVGDPSGALASTLFTWVSTDIRVSRQLDTPLRALSQIIDSTLSEPTTFCEFARQVAIAQAKLTGDRPYFQAYGQSAHPDAEHTHHSIQTELKTLLTRLEASQQDD